MSIQVGFGKRVAKARMYAGYSQRTAALALGCNKKTIARWEQEKAVRPDPKLLLEFARLTDSKIAWLYDGGDGNANGPAQDDRDQGRDDEADRQGRPVQDRHV